MTDAITLADCAALIARSLAVGAILTERLLELPEDSDRNPANDYGTISRAMRQSVLLLERIAPPPIPEQSPDDRPARRTASRQEIIRAVEDVIGYRANGRDPEALRAELLERLHDEALDAELDSRPTADLVTELCRDLGLTHASDAQFFKRRTPDDVATLRAHAARQPGANTAPPPGPAAAPARRAPLSTPSLILPKGVAQPPAARRPEAHARDQR